MQMRGYVKNLMTMMPINYCYIKEDVEVYYEKQGSLY